MFLKSEEIFVLLQKIESMSTYEIIGIIFGSITIFSLIWGAIWAYTKLIFKLGKYKQQIDSAKEDTDDKIKELNASFMSFSSDVNTKLDNISNRLAKVEGKLEK